MGSKLAGKKKLGGKRSIEIRKYLLQNPMATNDLVVRVVQVSTRLVSLVRKEMREEGLIPKLSRDHTSKHAPRASSQDAPIPPDVILPEVRVPETQESDVKKLLDLAQHLSDLNPDWSPEDQLKLCKYMANDTTEATTARQSAMALYRKIKAELEGKGQLGPGPPLTREDRIVRLARLDASQGLDIATAALERAFNVGREIHEADPSEAAPGVPEVDEVSGADDPGESPAPREGEFGVGRGLNPNQSGPGPGEQDRVSYSRTDPHNPGQEGSDQALESDPGGAHRGGLDEDCLQARNRPQDERDGGDAVVEESD